MNSPVLDTNCARTSRAILFLLVKGNGYSMIHMYINKKKQISYLTTHTLDSCVRYLKQAVEDFPYAENDMEGEFRQAHQDLIDEAVSFLRKLKSKATS